MFKKYNPKPIHSYKSYKISDLCRIYKAQDLHPQTIRKWIKQEGLQAFLHEGDFYIHGAVFKAFLTNRNQQHKEKNQLEFNQFRCGKCKSKQPPLDNIISKLTTGFNDSIKAFGVCRKCGDDRLKRPYKRSELAKIKEIFQIKLDEVSTLYNCSNGTNKTNINDDQILGCGESLKNHSHDVKNIPPPPPENETMQLTLFDFLN